MGVDVPGQRTRVVQESMVSLKHVRPEKEFAVNFYGRDL